MINIPVHLIMIENQKVNIEETKIVKNTVGSSR